MNRRLFFASLLLFTTLSFSRLAAQNPSGAVPGASKMNTPVPEPDSAVDSTEAIAEPDEFVPVEKEPDFDVEELYSKIRYPEEARKNNIEGTVIIMVYIDKDGFVRKTRIVKSDHPLLKEAALDAIYRIAFTPAIQLGKPVGVWFSIPINFSLN